MRILDFSDGFESSSEPTSVQFPASSVSVSPTGNLSSTTGQAALVELQEDIDTINAKVGAANGIASLDSNGQIPSAQIPAIAIITVYSVADITARNALTVQSGDVAIVADNGSGIQEEYMYDGTAWKLLSSNAAVAAHAASTTGIHGVTGNLVGTSDTQALTNKDIDGGTASNTNRITLPKAAKTTLDALTRKQGTIVFDTTSGKPYYDDGSNLQLVGSGSGGSKNYISGGDAESGLIGTSYADGAAVPVDGTGGSPTCTLAVSSTSPLSGTNSLLYTPGALGNGRAFSFTLDREDFAKVMEIELSYELGGTGFADGDLQLWIIAPSGAVIQPAGYKVLNVGLPSKLKATFQTESSGTSYKILLHQATATSTYTCKFELKCGPQVTSVGAFVGDWQSFTPTGSWTSNTTYVGKWRRVGDSMQVMVKLSLAGAPTSASLTVNLPSGVSIDAAKMNAGSTTEVVGVAHYLDAGVQNYVGDISYNTSTSVIFRNTTSNNNGTTNQASPFTFGSSDTVDGIFTVPISGWGTSQVLSSDSSEGRVVTARAALSASTSAGTGTATLICDHVNFDDFGSYDNTTGIYTFKIPGRFRIGAAVTFQGATTAAGSREVYLKTGSGTSISRLAKSAGVVLASGDTETLSGSSLYDFKAGDTFKIVTVRSTDSVTIYGDSTYVFTYIDIEKVAGNQQLAASESVNARYYSSSTAAFNGGVAATFATKSWDSHGAFNGTTFTAPAPGKYNFSGIVQTSSASWTVGNVVRVYGMKNGSGTYAFGEEREINATNTYKVLLHYNIEVDLLFGETFKIITDASVSCTFSGNADRNYLQIKRTGN